MIVAYYPFPVALMDSKGYPVTVSCLSVGYWLLSISLCLIHSIFNLVVLKLKIIIESTKMVTLHFHVNSFAWSSVFSQQSMGWIWSNSVYCIAAFQLRYYDKSLKREGETSVSIIIITKIITKSLWGLSQILKSFSPKFIKYNFASCWHKIEA